MDNKLSELKDVVDYWRKVKSGELPAPGSNEISITVCALDEAVSRIAALLAELEAKTKHISDMGHVVAAAKCDDVLWDAMAHRLKTLEAKLATPVRLPPLMDGELFGKNSAAANAHNNAITACSIAIRGAGFKSEATVFKCEGDEQ